ncbi:MAG: branched-chain amino acid ABC transporter permease, partial [Pseudomonadota bacterium]
ADMTTKSSVTLIFALALLSIAERLFGDDPRLAPQVFPQGGLALGDVVVTYTAVIGVAVAIMSVLAADWLLRKTIVGFQLRALSEKPRTAMLHALPVMRLTIGIWMVTGAFAYFAILLIMPSRPVSLQILTLLMLPGFAAALLGAFKSIHLALVGGFLLGLLEALAAQQGSVILRSIVPFLVILSALLWIQRSERWDDAR